MKAHTNNMVGITDQLDASDKNSNFNPAGGRGGPLFFLDKEHRKYYQQMIQETYTGPGERKELTLLYLLASLKEVRKNPSHFFNFEDMEAKPRAFQKLLSQQEKALLQLAFYLYTENNIFKIGVLDLFNNLNQKGAVIAISAIKLRFSLYLHED
ncbi:MAG: DUF6075 family protein [Bacillota bacterium]